MPVTIYYMPLRIFRSSYDTANYPECTHLKSSYKAAYIISYTLLKNVNINLTSLLGNFVIKLQPKKLIPSTIFLDAKAISGH